MATFSATDPEGDSITWKLEGSGVDNADFEIGEDTGVLTFKSPPNYESPTDRDEDPDSDIDQGVGDRMYKVSITANGGDAFVLTVEVTNEDEPGSVSLDKPQPQVGRPLAAIDFDDPDGADEKTVQWYSGPDKDDGPWTDLEVTNESYTPKAADAGNYLRVVYTYNDSFGDGKTAEAVSENVVEDKTLSNARPVFDGKDASTEEGNPGFQVSLTSKEGAAAKSNIGNPVSATDEDNDTLRYSIVADAADAEPGTDDEKFSIDAKSGQLKVGSKALDFEPAGSVGANGSPGTPDQMYVVTVRVVDPSGASADADVTITLEDVNEPPIFNPASDKLTTLYIAENTAETDTNVFKAEDSIGATAVDDDDGTDVTYLAVDDDNITGETPADTVTYSLEGGDATKFAVDAQNGGLTKMEATEVDFETKSSYSIAVIAKSSRVDDEEKMIDMFGRVVVTVKVVNSNDPGVVSFTQREPQVGSSIAASIDDLDGNVTNVEWQWYRLTAEDAATVGTDDGFTAPVPNCVAEMVGGESCVLEKATSASYTPTQYDFFADNPETEQATEGRYLAARATYNDKFNTVGDKEMYFGVTDTDVQEDDPANGAPEFKDQDRNAPGVQDETVTREIAENTDPGMSVGDAFTAEDPNDDLLMYELEGPDADSFQLSDLETGSTINLLTKAKLDYETKTEYTVTIKALDPSGADDTITVTVMVTGVNEGAAIDEVETVMYAENGEDPVATFTATDPEGDAITWKLGAKGVDNGKFEIGEDDGVLTFKDSPDFESAGDGDEDPDSVISQGVGDRMYKVSITANGGSPFVLTVEVTNEDEPGSVSLDKPQPQVGRPLAAIDFDDPDGADEKTVQWYSGPDKDDGPWADLEVTNESYTPKAADAGNYLRVVYTYNDSFGDGKTAEAVSENVVEDKTLSNARPVFDGKDASTEEGNPGFQVSLTSKEGAAAKSNIGNPVSATDEDNDTLRYSIVADAADAEPGTDDEKFSIDAKSGQLKVGSKALDFEPAGSVGANGSPGTPDQMYVVTVRVVDPSGASADADVTITLEDVNEPPIFNPASDKLTTLYIAENTAETDTNVFKAEDSIGATAVDDDDGTDVTYLAVDDDNITGETPADTVTYSLEGGDATKFAVDESTGAFTKQAATEATIVNFETKPSYSLAVIAKSSRVDDEEKMIDMFDRVVVTVKVVNNNDLGVVSLTQREPQVDSSIAASIEDDDLEVSYVEWQWYRLIATDVGDDGLIATLPEAICPAEAVGDAGCVIEKAKSASYTPTQYDLGRYLAARATYSDKFNDRDNKTMADGVSDADVQAADAANTAPEFKDQERDVPGVQDEMVTREVAENTDAGMNVGDEFSADDSADGDLLMYELGGPDADSFGLSDPSGISNSINLLTKAPLDYETKTEYTVTIKAMDPSGASDMITVTVMVTDVNEGSTISFGPAANTAPAFDAATAEGMVDENMPMGAEAGMVMATDEDGDTLTYSDDSMYFDVDDMGNITTTMMLDHEAMASHSVTVTATDDRGGSDSIDVTVNVGNVVECEDAGATAVADRTNVGAMSDCEALLASRDALMGDDATRMLNWSADTPIADWYGVRKLSESGRVEWLYLHGVTGKDATDDDPGRAEVKLNGTIPAELGGLTEMTRLYLHRNNLSGGIPAELNGLTNLVWLRLYDNMLSGEVPDLSGMTSLGRLYIHQNQLTGGVPTALSVSVTHILVHRNMLTGEIPDLSGMPSLVWLSLYENGLSGEIPAELGNLADLQRLYLHGNMLTGMAPMELGNLVDLNNLLLMNNDLTGDIPTEWGALNLNRLWINNSGLTGCVPEGLVPTLTLVNSLGVETLPSDDITDSGLSVCTADDGS